MRTNIEIDDALMKKVMRVSGARTKKAAVEAALQFMLKIKAQDGIMKLRGRGQWEGDLGKSRLAHGEE